MKHFILLCASFLMATQAFAAPVKTYSCSEIYQASMANKLEKVQKYNKAWNTQRGDTSLNGALTYTGFIMAAALSGSAPVIIAATVTPAMISMIKNLPSREEKALKLQSEVSKGHKRYVKRLQKEVSERITSEEVVSLLEEGFNSGLFCDNLPKLASSHDIRKHVRDILEARYENRQEQ